MLKIDLLPSYVREAQKVRSTLFLFGFLLVVELTAIGGLYSSKAKEKPVWEKKIAKVDPKVTREQQLEADIAAIDQGTLPPIQQLVDFYKQSQTSSPQSLDVYRQVAPYISAQAELSNVQLTNTTATLTGRITGVEALGQFLLNFMRCPAFSSVQFSMDLQPFSYGGGGGGGQQGGGPGGGMPGMGGGMGPGGGGMGAGGGGMGPGGGGMGGGGQATQVSAPAGFIQLPTQQVSFTLTCTLAKPLTTPTGGGGGGAAGGMGMAGMGGGMPGGAPGGGGMPGAGGGGMPGAPGGGGQMGGGSPGGKSGPMGPGGKTPGKSKG